MNQIDQLNGWHPFMDINAHIIFLIAGSIIRTGFRQYWESRFAAFGIVLKMIVGLVQVSDHVLNFVIKPG
jgi:hypothetical protein